MTPIISQIFTGLSKENILKAAPRTILLSGPSGFLGSRVLDAILDAHQMRSKEGLKPGEVILLSNSPGRTMHRLNNKYGSEMMKTVRASRVDYYTQHDVETWIDHLGSLGCEGEHTTFVNLAAVAGPVDGKLDAMMQVNYHAVAAAVKACDFLGFGHWIQSSTQATNAERGGQVPYARAKAMADYSLIRTRVPVTVACLGLLYSKEDATIGQSRSNRGENLLNLIDLALLPLTPIMVSRVVSFFVWHSFLLLRVMAVHHCNP
jgi:nucleoside-diphosphate-sugar epimerase